MKTTARRPIAWIGILMEAVARLSVRIDIIAFIAAPLIMLASSVSILWRL